MVKMREKREKMKTHNKQICPAVLEKLEKLKVDRRCCLTPQAGRDMYEVEL